jgi:hypothetical protein
MNIDDSNLLFAVIVCLDIIACFLWNVCFAIIVSLMRTVCLAVIVYFMPTICLAVIVCFMQTVCKAITWWRVGLGFFCFCRSLMPLHYFWRSVISGALLFLALHVAAARLFLLLCDATRTSAAWCCRSYCCCSFMCRIHSSVDICEQRHAPKIWVRSSEVDLKMNNLLFRVRDQALTSEFFIICCHEIQHRCICRLWLFIPTCKYLEDGSTALYAP